MLIEETPNVASSISWENLSHQQWVCEQASSLGSSVVSKKHQSLEQGSQNCEWTLSSKNKIKQNSFSKINELYLKIASYLTEL